jgi:small GTP-binding protein
MKKKITIGILAHVDAGKTTLSEALLYTCGKIRTLGRVDHKNTYLDTNAVERERGITIFSKQARFSSDECDFILLDTPGHVDFSAEAERVLSLLDYAILVISGADGVQNHTKTLWSLLEFYRIPTFIFVNKCDIAIKTKDEQEEEICSLLSKDCVALFDTQTKNELDEKLALINEDFLDTHLSGEKIEDNDIAYLISERRLFPIVFGSALKTEGVEFLIKTIDKYSLEPIYEGKDFGAKIYKISRQDNTRLTYMKITSGTIKARDEISYLSQDGRRITEKISQIRLYSGDKYEQVESASAGDICAVIGLSATYIGQGLGMESDTNKPILEPVLSYRIILPNRCDLNLYFPKLKELEAEQVAASPGMKYIHYSPKANVIVVEGDTNAFKNFISHQNGKNVYSLIYDRESKGFEYNHMTYGNTSEEQAHLLFQRLRELDEAGAETVYVRPPSKEGVGLAVYNRLIRAAGFEVIRV